MNTCYARVREYYKERKEEISGKDLREIAQVLIEKQAENLPKDQFNLIVESTQILRRQIEAAQVRAAKILDLEKRTQINQALEQSAHGAPVDDRVIGFIAGNLRKLNEGLNKSVEGFRSTLASQWTKQVRTVLNETMGDLQIAERGLLTREITQEMANLEKGGVKAVSGSEVAHRIAKAYNGVLASIFKKKQAYDPFIGKIQNYFYRATHDLAKIGEVTQSDWTKFILEMEGQHLFPEMTAEAKVLALGEIYDDIIAGRHSFEIKLGKSTTGDIARRMARSRTITWSNWENFHKYNERFGNTNVHQTMLRTINSAAHDLALIDKFGTNPRENFNQALSSFKKKLSPVDQAVMEANEHKINDYFNRVAQFSNSPVTGNFAKASRGMQAYRALVSLGNVWMNSWTDGANFTTAITDANGRNYLSNFVDSMKSYADQFTSSKAARQEALESMGLMVESSLHNLYQEMGTPAGSNITKLNRYDKFMGWVSKGLEWQSWASLADRHRTATEAGMANTLSKFLGDMSDRPFEQLHIQTQGMMKRYGWGKAEWEVVRQGLENWSGEGFRFGPKKMLTVDGVSRIPDEVIGKYLTETRGVARPTAAMIERTRTSFETSLGTAVYQAARSASSTAGAAEHAAMYRWVDPNSPQGAILHMVLQFKSALLKNYDTIQRSRFSNPLKPQGDKMKVFQHVILASGLWAASRAVQDLLDFKTPESPAQASYVADALLSSGAAGAIGDSLFAELLHDGTPYQIASQLARRSVGPAVMSTYDIGSTLWKAGESLVNENTPFPAKDLAKVVADQAPFQKLFYLKAAYNYTLLNEIRGWGNASYLSDQERKLSDHPGLLGDQQETFGIGNANLWGN